MERLRCKAGDLALVIYETPECIRNVGRLVRVRGPVKFNSDLNAPCWLIEPVNRRQRWWLDSGGYVRPVSATHKNMEHPDPWLLPLRPQDGPQAEAEQLARGRPVNSALSVTAARAADLQARLDQVRIDREVYRARHPQILCPASDGDLTIAPVNWFAALDRAQARR